MRLPRAAVVLAIALPLAAADLIWKHFATTPEWAYHPRGFSWLVLSCCLMTGALVAARFASLTVALAAGVMVGGVLGNVLSAAWNGLAVPDPIIIFSSHAVIAFNLADIFASSGILALMSVLAVTLIRNRHLLPTHEQAKGMRRQLLRRRH